MQNNEWVRDKEDRIMVLEQTLTTANLGTFIADTMVECQEVVTNGRKSVFGSESLVEIH